MTTFRPDSPRHTPWVRALKQNRTQSVLGSATTSKNAFSSHFIDTEYYTYSIIDGCDRQARYWPAFDRGYGCMKSTRRLKPLFRQSQRFAGWSKPSFELLMVFCSYNSNEKDDEDNSIF
ncbi:hypothetical protein AVEN_8239-1 [Araneus ventricosus]|uniref:Uncharacterized protein n=1 Tax=Araneus ventricosus TaxID=182803 RepID=A0A4Y2L0H1_ARAVE|nr:hypothetical protein AVEN_8239-1 [Araneus ventricosus]